MPRFYYFSRQANAIGIDLDQVAAIADTAPLTTIWLKGNPQPFHVQERDTEILSLILQEDASHD